MTHRRSLLGRRFVLPQPVAVALGRVFGESIGAVIIIERSRYARAHWGMCATTRPNRILLAIHGSEFVNSPDLLLHEYFHEYIAHNSNTHVTRSAFRHGRRNGRRPEAESKSHQGFCGADDSG